MQTTKNSSKILTFGSIKCKRKNFKAYSYFFLISFILLSLGAQAQKTASYSYDAAGNRVFRTLLTKQLAKINNATNDTIADNSNNIDGISLNVYPNPTTSTITVEINQTTHKQDHTILLYDLSGHIYTNKTTGDEQIQLDLSNRPAGTYILRVYGKTQNISWKVIKE